MTTSVRLRPYQKLIVWKEAHALCLQIYKMTSSFPKDERFGLTSQMRKSSYSVPTNIAEGSGKQSLKEKDRFFEYSWCSLEELHYQCLLARDLTYISEDAFSKASLHLGKVSYLLLKLRQSLQ
jgi:four helix bundle protein